MELSGSNINKFLMFQEIETLKNLLIFQEAIFPAKKKKIHPEKVSYTSRNGNPQKIPHNFSKENYSYISGNRARKIS